MADRDKEIWALHEENAVLEDKLTDYRKRNEELIIKINCLQAELKVCNEALDNSMKLNSHLQAENEDLKTQFRYLDIECERLEAENETLRGVVKQNHLIRENNKSPLALLTTEIKAEAYKEFAEKLLDAYEIWTDNDELEYQYVAELVYNLLKELVGEDK